MSSDLHPDVEPAVAALDGLLLECPSVEEYADVLESLGNATGPCLITALGDLLDQLGRQAEDLIDLSPTDRALIADQLDTASSRLGSVVESINRARALTGEWTR